MNKNEIINTKNKDGETTKPRKEDRGSAMNSKITVTVVAEKQLDEMVSKVNEGFAGGRVTRQDLGTWIVGYFQKSCFDECLEMIRAAHFDQLAYLESVVKQAKLARKNGEASPDLKTLLSTVMTAAPQRKTVRATKQLSLEPKASSDFT